MSIKIDGETLHKERASLNGKPKINDEQEDLLKSNLSIETMAWNIKVILGMPSQKVRATK